MAKSGKSAAAATVGRPKGVTVGRTAPGNFTFTSSKTGSGSTTRTANIGSRPGLARVAGSKAAPKMVSGKKKK